MAESDRLNPILKITRFGDTLPKKFEKASVIKMAQGAAIAEQLGMPSIGKTELLNKIALEGRSDAGANEFNKNNKKAQALFDSMIEMGLGATPATYAAAVLDKSQLAERLGIPFEHAWNGTGRSRATGRTGAQHAARAEQMKGAKDLPQNREAADLIDRAMAGELTGQENLLAMSYSTLEDALFPTTDAYKQYGRRREKEIVASLNVSAALAAMNSTSAGRKAVKELPAEQTTFRSDDLVQKLPVLYKDKSGIDTRTGLESFESYKNMAASPMVDVMLGVDPGAEKFLAEAQKKYPSVLDKILSFFN